MVKARTSSIVIWLLSIAVVWIVTARLGHRLEPWAIQLTNPAFAVSLGWTYVAAWCVAVAAAKKRRLAIVRAVAVTLSLVLCLLMLFLMSRWSQRWEQMSPWLPLSAKVLLVFVR